MWKRWLALALVTIALVHGEVGDRFPGFAPQRPRVRPRDAPWRGGTEGPPSLRWSETLVRSEQKFYLPNLDLDSEVVWAIKWSPTTPNMEGGWGVGRGDRLGG